MKNRLVEIMKYPTEFFDRPKSTFPRGGLSYLHELYPWDVLIEASATGDESPKPKDRADIVLLGKKDDETKILLVIEMKKPVAGTPTKGFKKALEQAFGYAKQLDCNYYAVYDGDTIIIMQRQHPFLVGLAQRYIRSDEQSLDKFALEFWSMAHYLNSTESVEIPTKFFRMHKQYYSRWKKTIRFLIKDAYKKYLEEQSISINMEMIEKKSEEICKKWDELNT